MSRNQTEEVRPPDGWIACDFCQSTSWNEKHGRAVCTGCGLECFVPERKRRGRGPMFPDADDVEVQE